MIYFQKIQIFYTKASRGMPGAAKRAYRPDISCPLNAGELVRVEYNGRFSEPLIGWSYHHVVVNIICTAEFRPDSFLAQPDHYLADLAELY